MIAPLIISIAAALLCSGCIGVFLWQVGQLLAGDTSWAEASMPLILSQLGILFFAIFAMAFWRTYKDEMVESKPPDKPKTAFLKPFCLKYSLIAKIIL